MQYLAIVMWALYVAISLWESYRDHCGEESFEEASSRWGSVRPGMDAADIRRELGDPGWITATPRGAEWRYQIGHHNVVVGFRYGKVVDCSTPQAA